MNLTIARALLEDSRQQVLDNKVFRLLVLLTAIPILASFLIGFYPDHLQLLWGFEPIYWRDMPNFLGGTNSPGPEHAAAVIQGWQGTIVDFFAGNLGVLFCIAATAFFMPRVLEKGAADTMFSKPVGRLAILLSRYFAGLLFVGAIAFVLVFGMFLGFGLRSGYWDPGFLWGALTLVYLFGMMHAFSLCVAVLTRSSTAAILLTFVLYALSSAFHGGWMIWSYVDDKQASEELRAALQGPDAGEDDDAADGGERKGGDPGVVLDFLRTSLSVAHYILPKTSDADLITAKLRRALSERASDLASADDEIEVKRAPLGFHLVESTRDDLDGAGVRWEADSGAQAGSYVLRRFARPEVERGSGARARTLPQTGIWRAKDLADELQARTDLLRAPEYDSESLGGVRAGKVTWQEPSANGPRERERLCFHVNDHMYELDVDLSTNGEEAYVAGSRRQRFLADKNLVIGNVELLEPGEWYAQKFDWTAPWRFNVFFSIGSSLAFILAMLGIAWWRLARIDF
ncbi:MAG: ABC transporter permease [Planctomycetes bacterium]|nr:ABC transporter permease [Planctomycetota bacterium]